MNIKNILRRRCNKLLFYYNRFLKQRKVFFIGFNGNWFRDRMPFVEKFSYIKKSDTLFILGSGDSVNELTEKQYNIIEKSDSVGFNNWLINDFVPDFYMFEGQTDKTAFVENEMQKFVHNLSVKKDQYNAVKIIFKMNTCLEKDPGVLLKHIPQELQKNIFYSPVISLSYHDTVTLRLALRHAFQYLDCSKGFKHIHTAASIFDLIAFGVKNKFKKIVLVGIDLTASYFFEGKEAALAEKNLRAPDIKKRAEKWSNYKKENVHGTERVDIIGNVPISVILDEIDKMILQPKGIQLYVASRTSKLYPRFPCYFD